MENYRQYYAVHEFLVWLRTDSNSADIKWFRSPLLELKYYYYLRIISDNNKCFVYVAASVLAFGEIMHRQNSPKIVGNFTL